MRFHRRHRLAAVLPPVTRHALLRIPGVALALAALGLLGLGGQPPSPEWGLLLAENLPYAERAPWVVPVPAAALALLGALAVIAAGGARLPRPPQWTWVRGSSATPRQPERGATPMRHTAAVTAREDFA